MVLATEPFRLFPRVEAGAGLEAGGAKGETWVDAGNQTHPGSHARLRYTLDEHAALTTGSVRADLGSPDDSFRLTRRASRPLQSGNHPAIAKRDVVPAKYSACEGMRTPR